MFERVLRKPLIWTDSNPNMNALNFWTMEYVLGLCV